MDQKLLKLLDIWKAINYMEKITHIWTIMREILTVLKKNYLRASLINSSWLWSLCVPFLIIVKIICHVISFCIAKNSSFLLCKLFKSCQIFGIVLKIPFIHKNGIIGTDQWPDQSWARTLHRFCQSNTEPIQYHFSRQHFSTTLVITDFKKRHILIMTKNH